MCFIFLNACLIYRIKYDIVISWRSAYPAQNGGITVWYQSQGLNVEPRWASWVVFGPRVWGEIVSGEPISDMDDFKDGNLFKM